MGASSSESDWLQSEMVALTKRLLAHVENGTTDHANDVFREPVANYTDPVKWEREREILFRRSPLLLGLSADISEPGSYRSLNICDVPILLIRGEDGVARSFINVCRHRGAPIVEDERGRQRRYTCVYHAWTYDTSGCLVGLPSADAFDGIVVDPGAGRAFTVDRPHGRLRARHVPAVAEHITVLRLPDGAWATSGMAKFGAPDVYLPGEGATPDEPVRLVQAVAQLFGQYFRKSKKQSTSNWSLRELSDAQQLYAANDAWVAWRVWRALQPA